MCFKKYKLSLLTTILNNTKMTDIFKGKQLKNCGETVSSAKGSDSVEGNWEIELG